ncbi:MAG: hypothetical protein SGBAC_001657 [Bacillariaceae sp.]
MGWWSLGPEYEDEESMEMPPPLPVRRVRGGAGRVPGRRGTDIVPDVRKTRTRSPGKSKQTKAKKRPRVVVGTPNEEELSLFASIGRMVNSKPQFNSGDGSTLGTAKYPGQNGIPVEAALNNANEAQRRANEMANAMAWLTNPTATTAAQETSQDKTDLFKDDSENWWDREDAGDNTPVTLNPEEMPELSALLKLGQASYIDSEIDEPATANKSFKAKGKELTAEKQALDLQRSLEWLQSNSTNYVHEQLEYTEDVFETVDAGQWKPKTTPSADWERCDPRKEPKGEERIAKDLKQSLDFILNCSFDKDLSFEGPAMNRLRDFFANWKVREHDDSKELQDALSWWKLHARNYDTATASEEETDRFLESKRLLASLGFTEEDVWDGRKQEMEDALALWANNKSKPTGDLDEGTIEKMKKIEDILVQINRDGLTISDMTSMAKEMDGALTWYLVEGRKIEDFSKVKQAYQSNFQMAQGLLSLWRGKVDLLPNRQKDAVELLIALEEDKNKCSLDIVDKYYGKDGTKFQKLHDAVMDWKSKGFDALSTAVAKDEAVHNDIERVLDWWVASGDKFNVATATGNEFFMAQIAESILDIWIPRESGEAFSFRASLFTIKEIKGALALYRNGFEDPEMLRELSQDMNKGGGIISQHVKPNGTSWVCKEADRDISDNSESPDVDDPKSGFHGVVAVGRFEEEKRAKEMSNALDWLRRKDSELDIDDEMSVALSVATFKKIDALMPKTSDDLAPTTMDGALDWLYSKTTLDDETVSRFKKVDDILVRSGASDTINEVGFAGALEWLRKRQAKKAASKVDAGPTNYHNDAEHVTSSAIPKSEDERRAEQMESALDWLRSSSHDPAEAASVCSGHGSLGAGLAAASTISIIRPGERSKDVDSTHDWLTNVESSPQEDCACIGNNILPVKKSQDASNRERNLGTALDWNRNHPIDGNFTDGDGLVDKLGSKTFSNLRPKKNECESLPEALQLGWERVSGGPTNLRDHAPPLFRSCDVNIIPRDDPSPEVESDDVGWLAHVNRLFPGVPDERMTCGNHGMLNAIPSSQDASHDFENHHLDWIRHPVVEAQLDDETMSYLKSRDIQLIPPDGPPNSENMPNDDWNRHGGPLRHIPGEELMGEAPQDFLSVPRSGRLHEAGFPELSWRRNPAWEINKIEDTENVDIFDRPNDLRSIPRRERSNGDLYPCIDWDRVGRIYQEMTPYEGGIFDRPGDLRSIPRDVSPSADEFPTMTWGRNDSKRQGLEETDTDSVFDRPGDVRSIPRAGNHKESCGPEFTWERQVSSESTRLRVLEEVDSESRRRQGVDSVFDGPGDVRSIPRDGKHKESYDPEFTWERQVSSKSTRPRIPAEVDTVFDRPGDVRSIPRDGKHKESYDSEFIWERQASFESRRRQGVEKVDAVFDRHGDVRSIPRDGKRKESYDSEFTWERQASFESIPGVYGGNAFDQPRSLRSIPRDGHPHDEPAMNGERNWSGGRPNRVLTFDPSFDWVGPEPTEWENNDATYDWMITSPKGQDASYDWSGARPFERPETALVSISTTSINEAIAGVNNRIADDLSEFTELGEEKPRPVTGVPCAAWTMLALGAAAGGAMTSGTAPQGAAVASQFANNQSVGSTTDRLYPDPGYLPNCSTDANCQIIMDGLSPVIPPDVLGLFDFPGTCQSKARDWLRTGEDILEFKAERIRQRYAMSVFFCEMDGGDWIEGDSWLSDLHECDWYNKVGLDPCNRNEQMEMLRVTDNGLAGSLPEELFILSNLYEFTLANNLISGSLPQLFDKFKELDTLVIPFNQFDGSFPHQIWEYPDMVYLDVAYNGFTGTIPADIDTRMPNLQVAFLENNNLSGPIPETLGNLKQLHRLHLDDNKFTGKIPHTLGLPPRLSELLLHDNLLTGEVPKQLGDLNRLQLLTLHYNSFDEQTIDEHICDLIYNKQLELATVDKATIDCGCCASGEESFV